MSIIIFDIAIYDILGREMADLIDADQEPGIHQVNWNASNLPSGL